MPGLRELYSDMYHHIMGAIAHPLRGIIIEPIEGPAYTAWQTGDKRVTIRVTPSGASYPRKYVNVPYSGLGSGTDFATPPSPGDYVDVVFKGGSTEFPTIIGRHGGDASSKAAAVAVSTRVTPPTQATSMGIFSSTNPGMFSEFGADLGLNGSPSLQADIANIFKLKTAPIILAQPLDFGPMGLGTISGSNFSKSNFSLSDVNGINGQVGGF